MPCMRPTAARAWEKQMADAKLNKSHVMSPSTKEETLKVFRTEAYLNQINLPRHSMRVTATPLL